MSMEGQSQLTPQEAGAVPLGDEINVAYGAAVTLIQPAVGVKRQLLVMKCVSGEINVRIGDFSGGGMPATAKPAAAVADGTGGYWMQPGDELVIPAPDNATVRGYAATDALLYYFT